MTGTQGFCDFQINVSSRIIQIATMFMKGVEMALLVNDACGAPIPWLMCCPWLFFDGKLFHYMCQKANSCKNLQELCDNRLTIVMRTERVRQAILEGLNVQFARPAVQGLTSPQGNLARVFHFENSHLDEFYFLEMLRGCNLSVRPLFFFYYTSIH